MPVTKALSPHGLTDKKGNTITFTDPLSTYYVESNGYAYSLFKSVAYVFGSVTLNDTPFATLCNLR
jgi:hypothetical protein